ncbi:MAG: glycogen/starch/alpha-glucan phosphorylase, partial [Cyanobacteria bacterium J06648_11]
LSDAITRKIGDNWIKNLDDLRKLEAFVEDASFREEWYQIKQSIKRDFATFLFKKHGLSINPESLYDVHIKRIHEYKRQHLNALHIISLYSRLKHDRSFDMPPRTFIFAGKAAPGYFMAKRIIKLITSIAAVIDADPDVRDRLKVVFIPDYNVKTSQHIYPAADLSEQISTAGKEASGTGNMKFSMNGALTIGTLDGANVEIREEVGAENFFLFGLTADKVKDLKASGYQPQDYLLASPLLKEAMELLQSGFFSHGDPELFRPIVDNLLYDDPYLVFADFQSYADCQQQVSEVYRDRDRWTRMSIINSARTGKFSSDRSIRDYCKNIWKVDPVSIDLEETTSLPSTLV